MTTNVHVLPNPTGHYTGTESKMASDAALAFLIAGNAVFTVRSKESGNRYTFKVTKAKAQSGRPGADRWFVSLLTGSDNTGDYTYLGQITRARGFELTRASKMTADSTPVKTFAWVFAKLVHHEDLDALGVEFFHLGHCGRCGRPLTVPESVESGYGPECTTKMGGLRAA